MDDDLNNTLDDDLDPELKDSDNSSSDDSPETEDSNERYVFELSDDGLKVLAAFEIEDGVQEAMSLNKNNTYEVLDDGSVVHTRSKPFGSEVTTFSDVDGDGFYVRVSEQWIGSSTPPTNNPVPALAQVLRYLPTDGDDDLAVREGDLSTGGLGADQFVIRETGDLRIGDFKQEDGDTLVFDTGLGLTGKEELKSYVTGLEEVDGNLVVEFAGGVAVVTLVGVTAAGIGWDDVVVLS